MLAADSAADEVGAAELQSFIENGYLTVPPSPLVPPSAHAEVASHILACGQQPAGGEWHRPKAQRGETADGWRLIRSGPLRRVKTGLRLLARLWPEPPLSQRLRCGPRMAAVHSSRPPEAALYRAAAALSRVPFRTGARVPYGLAMLDGDAAGNNLLHAAPALMGPALFESPPLVAALRALLGEGYRLHPHCRAHLRR